MNVNLLVDAIVRQTTVLIAQLATSAGARATLAHTANQVFIDLVSELRTQGLGNKVIADMFGMTLRAYYGKVARLAESGTDRGRSLWEALLLHVQEHGSISRRELLLRFPRDGEAQVRGVLNDLVDSGLVFRSGRGDTTQYRAADPHDLGPLDGALEGERLLHLVWITIYKAGPVSLAELAEHLPVAEVDLARAVQRLVEEGRAAVAGGEGPTRYTSKECVIPFEDPAGWEAAVFDHYQAVVTAICSKLRLGSRAARQKDYIGGSTFRFEVWKDHPYREDVLAFLRDTRERGIALRRQITAHNECSSAGEDPIQIVAYVGQTVIGLDTVEEGDL